jgi:protein-tyrosine-phosphatase
MKYNKILFLCVENAGRSVIAEAFAKKMGMNCESAGTVPSTEINPDVIEVMREKGVNIAKNRPRLLDKKMIDDADIVVIMGCSVEESCPAPLARSMKTKVVDWGLDDPKGKSIEEIRVIRDQIEEKVREIYFE